MITQEQIIKSIVEIKQYLKEGHSITLARHKACGNACSKLHRAVMEHEAYLPILNLYLASKKRSIRFNRDEDYNLISTKGSKSVKINNARKGY